MRHFDAFDIFGISQMQDVVTTIIENGRDVCKIDAWQPFGLSTGELPNPFISHCPTHSPWFTCCIQGCETRMGFILKQILATSIDLILELVQSFTLQAKSLN